MRKLFTSFFLLIGFSYSFSQQNVTVTEQQYDIMKMNGHLDPQKHYIIIPEKNTGSFISDEKFKNDILRSAERNACSCLIPLDTTFQQAMGSNDDGSSALLSLPFSFNYYGLTYNSLYINNNGNISFGSAYGTFSSNPFPDPTYIMIAPFWGDVDTRNGGGVVYYKINPGNIIIKWEAVGYYALHTDKVNTFQLILTDGNDTILPAGTNVAFCYGDMQWTTGDASNGINGFGGIPATVGVNFGNGVDYFQVGRFDSTGMQFDGPVGLNDGVDFLDPLEIYFNTTVNGNTSPLILNHTICDTIDVYTGDTIRNATIVQIPVTILAPETNQVVFVNITCDEPLALSVDTVINNDYIQQYNINFNANNVEPGIYTIYIQSTDDFIPAATAYSEIKIRVIYDQVLSTEKEGQKENYFHVFPNPASEQLFITSKNNENYSVEIFDITGKTILVKTASGNNSIDIYSFSQGMYFLHISTANGINEVLKICME